MTENPFSEPLTSGLPASIGESTSRLAIPTRLAVARRAVAGPTFALACLYLSWVVFLLFVIGVTIFEGMTGESISVIGGLVEQVVSLSDLIFPYNYPLVVLSLALAGVGIVGLSHAARQQNLTLARAAGVITFVPLLGPWLGFGFAVGFMMLRILRRRGVAKVFDVA